MPEGLRIPFEDFSLPKKRLDAHVLSTSSKGRLYIYVDDLKKIVSSTEAREFRRGVYECQTIYSKIAYNPISKTYRLALSFFPMEGFWFSKVVDDMILVSHNMHMPNGKYVTSGAIVIGKFIFINLLHE